MRVEPRTRQDSSLVRILFVVVLATLLPPVAAAQSAPSASDIRRMIEEKKYDEAEKALEAAGDVDSLASLRAELYRRTDRRELAYREYERIVAAKPDHVDALFWLATIDGWEGRTERAIAGYGKVLALSDCHYDALTGRARAYQRLDRFDEAEADLRKALQCHPGNTRLAEQLAGVLASQGREEEAIAILRENFSGADLEVRLGDLRLDQDDPRAAREHYNAALAITPDDPKVLEKLADAERELGNTAAALALYERSAELAGDGGDLYWIGLLSLRLGLLDRAEAAFDAMLEKRPGDSGALVGKSRIRRSQGRKAEAIQFVDQVLRRNPTNGEALVLRGALYSSVGRRREARRDFMSALERNPDDGDARLLLDRLGSAGFVRLSGRSSRTRVIEGLEDEGVIVDGVPIRPTRIEYLGDSGDLEFGFDVGAHTLFGGEVSRGREAVTNLDGDRTIYDFDVLTATAGFDQHPTEKLELSWRLGGTRYEPRSTGAIDTTNKFRGSAALVYDHAGNTVSLGLSSRPFIWRGFAGDTQFSIFEENSLKLSWDRSLGHNTSIRFSAGGASYGDGDSPVDGSVTLRWSRSGNAFFIRAGHDPFPARQLAEDGTLDFIDFDGVTIGGQRELGAGFRFSADGTWGRYGETPPDLVVDGERVEGPPESNTERRANATLEWSPRSWQPLTIGGAYRYADFDFRTGPYNTRNVDDPSLFIELRDDLPRVRYLLNVAHHWIEDDRLAERYDANSYEGRLELRLGRNSDGSGSYWFGMEGSYQDNDLDEERIKARVYLLIPF